MTTKNTKTFLLRLNEETYDKLKSEANENNMNVSEFLRFLINLFKNDNYTLFLLQQDKDWRKKIIHEISRYGNNLNQLTHNLNVMNYKGYSKFPHKRIEEEIENIAQAIKDLEKLKLKLLEHLG